MPPKNTKPHVSMRSTPFSQMKSESAATAGTKSQGLIGLSS